MQRGHVGAAAALLDGGADPNAAYALGSGGGKAGRHQAGPWLKGVVPASGDKGKLGMARHGGRRQVNAGPELAGYGTGGSQPLLGGTELWVRGVQKVRLPSYRRKV